ncbi:MAG: hypothetical protein ABIR54_10300 [Burkholderiaceae bacterium]
MPAPSIRPAADPLDDIDRQSAGVDTLMERQDRADLPGERSDQPHADGGDIYTDAARDVSRRSVNPNQDALNADREADREAGRVLSGDLDIDLIPAERASGIDDDDTIDETERAGDDSIR